MLSSLSKEASLAVYVRAESDLFADAVAMEKHQKQVAQLGDSLTALKRDKRVAEDKAEKMHGTLLQPRFFACLSLDFLIRWSALDACSRSLL